MVLAEQKGTNPFPSLERAKGLGKVSAPVPPICTLGQQQSTLLCPRAPGVIPGQPEGTRAAAGSWLCPAGRQHQGGPSSLSKGLQLSHPTAEEGAPPQGAEAEPPPPSLGQRQLWTISTLHYKDQKQHLQQEQVLCCPCSEGLSLQGLMWP